MTGVGEWSSDRRISRARVMLSGSSSLETPAERALDRVLRSGHKASVLRLYLSRLHPGGPRPHHSRVARCLFDDAVQQGGGQVFACANGDLVLMAGPEGVAALGGVLLRLFRREMAGERQVLGLWSLPEEEAAVRSDFAASPGELAIAEEPPAPLGAIAAIGSLLAATPHSEFIRRQRAVRIVGGRLNELFHEIGLSFPAIEARLGMPVPLGTDGYLARYLTSQFDGCVLEAIAGADLADIAAINIDLPLARTTSPSFLALREAAREARTLLGLEFDLAEAVAEFTRFDAVQDRLHADGCTVVLDGVDHQSLVQLDAAALPADLLKLRWCPTIPRLSAREQRAIGRALSAFGPDRVIIDGADAEAALVWGRAHGVVCFQGRHVDLMLAADRVRTCTRSAACSMRQCLHRATALDAEGQAGCFDTALLGGTLAWDAGHSPAVPA